MPVNQPPTAPYTYDHTRVPISDTDLARAAYQAGFRGRALVTAISVAIGESHGDKHAVNDKGGDFSVGLWQINVKGYLAQRLQRFGLDSWIDLWDPVTNAKAAYSISNEGRKFTPWSIYNHGAYLKYWDRANAAVRAIGENPSPLPSDPNPEPDPSADPNAKKAFDILMWWNQNPLSHTALTSWRDTISTLDAYNHDLGVYLLQITQELHININDPIGLYDAGSAHLVVEYLTRKAGSLLTPPDNGGIFGGLWDGLFGGLEPFFGGLEHGFYFLIIVIIGLVVLIVGFKARSGGTNIGTET